jgi:hypothetical protein
MVNFRQLIHLKAILCDFILPFINPLLFIRHYSFNLGAARRKVLYDQYRMKHQLL